MKNEEDNSIVNIPPLHETLEEKRPYLRTKKKLKRTNIPINSLKTAIDEDDYDFYVPSIPKIVLKVKYIKYSTSGKNPLLVEGVLMQQIQANEQLVQKKVAKIIPALLKF